MFAELGTPIGVSLREFLTILALFFTTLWTLLHYTRDWRTRRARLVELANRLPGPPAVPIFGSALRFTGDPKMLFQRVVDIIQPYEDVTPISVWMGPSLYVVVTAPRDIEVVLNSQQASNKGMAYKFLHPFIGDGLISGSGPNWKTHRKMVSHTLNPRVIREYVDVFNRRSGLLIEKLKPVADGRVIDILEAIEGCTIDIVCEAVMGCSDINAQDNPDQDFLNHTLEIYKIVYDRMMKIWLYPDCIFKLTRQYKKQCECQKCIHNFTEKCIAAKKKSLSDSKQNSTEVTNPGNESPSILERLLEINNETHRMTDEQLRDEIYTVYIAAQDTLALTCSFASLMLAMNQDAQEKGRKEVQDILADGEEITAESLNRMKYVEMILKETLRLFPIAPFMVRDLKEELTLEGCILPKGCQLMIAAYTTQRSKKYWTNPERFDPERFSAEETSTRHPYSYIPFSGGPMGCIGQKFALMSMKTVLANLLRSYKFTTKVRMEDVKLRTDISIRSIHGYKLSIEPLN